MSWLINTFSTSIGKKLLMALTGFAFMGFIAGHLAGNLTLYISKNTFNSYAQHLHALGPLINVVELGLLLFAIVHIVTGFTLFYQNVAARPKRYAVNKNSGGRTLGSRTMPYTGFIILLFVICHLIDFRFVDKTGTSIYDIVANAFSSPLVVVIYTLSMVVVAIHVSHGFWSACQSLGVNHSKYMPIISTLGLVFSVIIAIGFGFIPAYVSAIS